jgi:Uma2 family endonuclease
MQLHEPTESRRLRLLRERYLPRWQELVDDPELARWPGKIETDRFGRTVMSPPPTYSHASYIGKIIRLLLQLPAGRALPETPVLTSDGIKVPDVAWIGPEHAGKLESHVPLVLMYAPEICVEVLSPANSAAEMNGKRALKSLFTGRST